MHEKYMSILVKKSRVEPIDDRQFIIMSAPPPPQIEENKNKRNKLLVDSNIPARITRSKNPGKNTRTKKKI
jgi:hypothetical protein